ncbi:MAG: GNAT family N-acetyltransferase [Sphingomonadales bacterium]
MNSRGLRSISGSRPVSDEEARYLASKLRDAVGETADDATLLRVLSYNREIIRLADRRDGGEPGFVAYLPLNETGFSALKRGTLSRRSPDVAHLCRHGEAPTALYMWCVYAPGNFIPAIAAIAAHFEEIAPDGVPLFTSAATAPAARLFKSLGFTPATDYFPEAEADVLVVFTSGLSQEPEPTPSFKPATTTRVARSVEDTMKVFAIRAATYIADQACPYDEEFDGNDFCAAHILGEVGGEPAGCIRIRFFADFVKFERLAVRREVRKSSLAFRLVRTAIDYARAKGFRTMYGHARHDLVDFWSRFGFRPVEGRPHFSFSGVDYVEMEGAISAAAQPIDRAQSPYVIIRPEGAWDKPGPLDPNSVDISGQRDAA